MVWRRNAHEEIVGKGRFGSRTVRLVPYEWAPKESASRYVPYKCKCGATRNLYTSARGSRCLKGYGCNV